MKKNFNAIIKWLSINGRINRKNYFFLHLLPVFSLLVISSMFYMPKLFFLWGWIAIAGFIKRLKDINVKNIVTKITAGLGVWVVISVIVVSVGFISFLKGISGAGNSSLMENALLLFAIPLILILILPIIVGFIPGSAHENKYGPVPE